MMRRVGLLIPMGGAAVAIFHISRSGLESSLLRLAVNAHNVANVSTPGYRAQRADQVELRGGGARVAGISVNIRPGPLEVGTGGFQLAVLGDGLFRVATPRGDRFLRAGNFHVDAAGQVVTADGYPLQPPIQVPPDAMGFQVGPDGRFTVRTADGQTAEAGQIQLARFPNPQGLVREGDNLAAAGPASGAPAAGLPGTGPFGELLFGALEGSNVDLTHEMVDQVVLRAVAQANLSAIRTQDEMLGTLMDLTG
jgi:flagellar basal-body rod protein FlgG